MYINDIKNVNNFISKHFVPKEKFYTEDFAKNLIKFGPLNEDNNFRIMIRPTDFCNFNCDYCFSYSKHKANALSIEQIDTFMDKIKDIPNTQNISFYIHGGEPFTYKHIWYLFDKIDQLNHKGNNTLLIQTNLSLFNIDDIPKILKYKNTKFAISVHQNINYTDYIDKFKVLDKYNLIDNIEVMYTKHNKKNLTLYDILSLEFNNVDIYSIFNEMDKDIPRKVRDTDVNYKMITTTNQETLKFDDFYKKGLNYSFKGMLCEAGYKGILLNHDGNIYRCQADLFIYKQPFTNIDNYVYTPNIKTKICNRDCCICDLEYNRIKDDISGN